MLGYRMFFLDGTGRIERAHEFLAEGDPEAIKTAESWREGRSMELWQRERKVKIWS